MSKTAKTREIVDAYTTAWMGGDIETARTFLADDLRFRGSIDQFDRADDLMAPLAQLAGMLSDTKILERFYHEDRAALLYDCITPTTAGTIRTAEFFKLTDGKISEIRLVFDATLLRQMMQS